MPDDRRPPDGRGPDEAAYDTPYGSTDAPYGSYGPYDAPDGSYGSPHAPYGSYDAPYEPSDGPADGLSRVFSGLRSTAAELDATALAEALWLAATLPRPAPSPHSTPPEADQDRPPTAERPADTADRAADQGASETGGALPLHERLPGGGADLPGSPVPVERGRALPRRLELSRALRAFKRPWTAGLRTELDIEETIDGYARSGELIPAFGAAPERWFDLLLIVDRSLSMQVWRETVMEFERVLGHLGAFRLLRTWGLTFDAAGPVLHDHQGAVAGPDHALSPQGRRLVLVLSDCSAPGWHRPGVWRLLRGWAQSTAVALLDPLPPGRRRRTGLDLPGVTAGQTVPGGDSTTLRYARSLLLDEVTGGDTSWLPVPVLTFSPYSLGRWARAQMRGDPDGCDAVLIPASGRLEHGAGGRSPDGAAGEEEAGVPWDGVPPDGVPGDSVSRDGVPGHRLARAFVRTASPEAERLAVLCAPIGRIGLPLLQLLRHKLVPEASVSDVAELVTSDLVWLRAEENGEFTLGFHDGVQEELKTLLPEHEAWRVYGVLSDHVTAHTDSRPAFPSVAHDPNAIDLLPSELRPFGRATLDVLSALGLVPEESSGTSATAFIGSATRRIARGIDIDEIVNGLRRSSVPAFCDTILVHVRDPLPVGDSKPVKPSRFRLRFPAPEAHTRRDRSGSPGGGWPSAVPAVETVLPGDALAEVLRGVRPVFGDSAHSRAALLDLLGEERSVPHGRRAILAPLRGRRRVIGSAVFLRGLDRPAFEPNDLLLAAQLATHTALGIDKSLLYRREREARIAEDLQRAMLPERLPRHPGVQLASRYLRATDTKWFGGDWYDAFPLPGGRIALTVGDVMGRHLASAAITGQLLAMVRTFAGLDLPPDEVLSRLDEQVQRIGDGRMATCLYVVYDPASHRIAVANAGHLPPLLLHPGGRSDLLDIPTGAPVGVGGVEFETAEFEAPSGTTLLLYTDGLVATRERDAGAGTDELRARLSEIGLREGSWRGPPLEPLCDEVLELAGPGVRFDDIALLAARFEGTGPRQVVSWSVTREPRSLRNARELVRRTLAHWRLEELIDPVVLMVSEIVTNAVVHTDGPVTLRLIRTNILRCEVKDGSRTMPRLGPPHPPAPFRSGLHIVDALAQRWGATSAGDGKTVWFEFPLPGPAAG
ncbi:SAV_2336 N-terminal domain-related protein [Streptomyces sp. NPDC056909]|uniref:SAV_2336 N-terminal domain-related protein n=1 Tax=Streptomyces sp. NPDC056909 TaxID=3345963 RepID=UPI0036BE6567